MTHETDPKTREGPAAWDARLTIACFAVLIWLPLFALLVQPEATVSRTENRFLAKRPVFSREPERIRALPGEIEAWLDDHVGFRDWMIVAHAYVKVAWLGVSPSEKLIVGKQGWFFLDDPSAVGQHRGLARFSEDELAEWASALVERRDWLAARGIAFVLVLAPNKHAVYSEYMPDRLAAVADGDPYGQLVDHLRQHTDLIVVDLLPPLRKAKQGARLYHRTDTHWNDLGAYVAYREILAAVRPLLPGHARALEPIPVRRQRYDGPGIGLTSMVGLSEIYGEEMLALEKVEPRAAVAREHRGRERARTRSLLPLAYGVPGEGRPRAVMFRDSFANALIPYLSENFSRILFVWSRDLEPAVVESEKPDVVIQEIAGRLLDRHPGRLE